MGNSSACDGGGSERLGTSDRADPSPPSARRANCVGSSLNPTLHTQPSFGPGQVSRPSRPGDKVATESTWARPTGHLAARHQRLPAHAAASPCCPPGPTCRWGEGTAAQEGGRTWGHSELCPGRQSLKSAPDVPSVTGWHGTVSPAGVAGSALACAPTKTWATWPAPVRPGKPRAARELPSQVLNSVFLSFCFP